MPYIKLLPYPQNVGSNRLVLHILIINQINIIKQLQIVDVARNIQKNITTNLVTKQSQIYVGAFTITSLGTRTKDKHFLYLRMPLEYANNFLNSIIRQPKHFYNTSSLEKNLFSFK